MNTTREREEKKKKIESNGKENPLGKNEKKLEFTTMLWPYYVTLSEVNMEGSRVNTGWQTKA